MIIIPTGVSAAGVLGGFIRAIMTVKLSVTLPVLLVEAAAVGTAELVWTTRWVFCTIRRDGTSALILNFVLNSKDSYFLILPPFLLQATHPLTTFWGFV